MSSNKGVWIKAMWTRTQTLELVNLVGSVASIIGFTVLIVSWFSPPESRDTEEVLIQYVGFSVALVVAAASIVSCIFWVAGGLGKYPANSVRGVVVIGFKVCVCILIVGLAADAMIAAVKNSYWPHVPVTFFRSWWQHIFQ